MADFDIGDVKNTLNQLKDRLAGQTPQWGVWDKMPGPPPRTEQAPQLAPRSDAFTPPPSSTQLRPEQMPSYNHADDRTSKSVYDLINQGQRQNNRTQAAGLYLQAIQWANDAKDPALQAVSKVEYGLANMNWGFSQEGFKWILEAGSNNPTLYNPQTNKSFIQRLAQAGMPQKAVDLLMANGQADPAWYARDSAATQKLDQAMTGPVSVAPVGTDTMQPRRDTMAPPESRPDASQPQQQAGPWLRDQFNGALRAAGQERDHPTAFGLYKQAVDMADRANDPVLQATGRIEAGLALISWGSAEDGFKWLLDAGVKNPGIYDSSRNQALVDRLSRAGLPKQTIDMYLGNGQRDPIWHVRDASAARRLQDSLSAPAAADYSLPQQQQEAPRPAPAPQPFQPQIRKSPFG